MKRVIIVFIALVATTVVSNAQFFIDGDVGVSFDKSSSEYDNIKNPYSIFSINVSPQFGYWVNDKVAVGARATLFSRYQKHMTTNTAGERIERKEWSPEWRFSVFGRYKLWGTEKFSVLGESYILIGGNITKEKIGSADAEKVSTGSVIGIHVAPIVTYDLSEKFSIKLVCDFLDLGYDFQRTKQEYYNRTVSSSHFAINLQSSTSFRIGFIYNF